MLQEMTAIGETAADFFFETCLPNCSSEEQLYGLFAYTLCRCTAVVYCCIVMGKTSDDGDMYRQ